jgi:hypothetical protein
MLHLGRGHEVVTELDALVRRFPERERLAAQLMRALYGSGRQAEALAVYQGLRRRLVEELGVEPSEPVRKVHHRLLEHDPTLAPAGELAIDLPRRAMVFVGRDEEMCRIATVMRDARLVTLTGLGGVGKSRMALEVAAALDRSRFPDGVGLCEFDPFADGNLLGRCGVGGGRDRGRPLATAITLHIGSVNLGRDRNGVREFQSAYRSADSPFRQCSEEIPRRRGLARLGPDD